MNIFFKFLRAFRKDEEGVTAIEYGLIAALIAAGLVAGALGLKTELAAAFEYISTQISGATTPAAP